MSKTPPETKHNRAQPFSFKKKDWPDEGNKLKNKLEGKGGGATFDEYVRVLDGSEHPELFLYCGSRSMTGRSDTMTA